MAHRALAERSLSEANGEGLGAGAETDGVRTRHAGTMPPHLPGADRGEADDQACHHQRTEQQPQPVQQAPASVGAMCRTSGTSDVR